MAVADGVFTLQTILPADSQTPGAVDLRTQLLILARLHQRQGLLDLIWCFTSILLLLIILQIESALNCVFLDP